MAEVSVIDKAGGDPVAPVGSLHAILPRLREAGVHTVVYGVGSALQAASGFILIPLYTRHFDPATYGVFALLMLVGTFGAAAFSLGAASSLARSYFDYESEADRRRVTATSIYIVLCGGGLALGLGALFGGELAMLVIGDAKYAGQLLIVLGTSILAQVTGVLLVLARFRRRSLLVVGTNLVALVGTSSLIWYLLAERNLGLLAPILGMLVSQVAQLLWLGWALRHEMSVKGLRREVPIQLAYGIPAAMAGILYYALDSIDRVVLNHLAGTAAVGVYSLGYRVAFVINVLLVAPFAQIWTPMRLEYRLDPAAPRLFAVVLRYFVLLGLAASIVVGIFAGELIAVLSGGGAYRDAYRVVGLVMMGYVVYGALGIIDAGIIFQRRAMFHVYNFAAALIINVLLNFLLIPRFGIGGAAVATLVTYTLVAIVAGVVSQRLYRVPWELGRIVPCGMACLLALTGGLLLPVGGTASIAGKLAILAAIAPVLWFAGLTSEERERTGGLWHAALALVRARGGRRGVQ
jgi:O-antigen/teichoic acid export membrane protein